MNHIAAPAPRARTKPAAAPKTPAPVAAAGLGHNNPPPPAPLTPGQITAFLNFSMAALLKRRGDVVDALKAAAAAYPTIADEDALGEVAENIRMAKALLRVSKDRFVVEKAPFLAGGRAVDAWFKAFNAPIDTAAKPVQTAMNDYGTRIENERRAAAVEAQRIADEQAAEAAAAAADLMARATPPVEHELHQAFDQAAQAAREAEQAAELANARPAELTRTTGLYGATTSMRVNWKWRVTDEALIPREFLMPNPDAIAAAGRTRDASGKPTAVIPGIEFYPESNMGVR